MIRHIREYFSKEGKRKRGIRKAKGRKKAEVIATQRQNLSIHAKALSLLTIISDRLWSHNKKYKADNVISLEMTISDLLGSFCAQANWWDDPLRHGSEFDSVLRAKLPDGSHFTKYFATVLILGNLLKALLQIFYADSYKIAVTYSGLSDDSYNGRFEMWKHDTQKATTLLDMIKKIPTEHDFYIIENILKTAYVHADRIANLTPQGGIAEFDYSLNDLTAGAMAFCIPKNEYAKDKNLPVRHNLGDSSTIVGPFGRDVKIFPYTWLSLIFNKLTTRQLIEFLTRNGYLDDLRLLTQKVEKDVSTRIEKIEAEIDSTENITVDEWPIPLVEAVRMSDIRLVRESIKDCEHIEAPGSSPLIVAAEKGDLQIVKLLLDHSAEVNKYENGKTALIAATYNGHLPVVEELLKAGASVDAKGTGSWNGMDALIVARKKKHNNIVRLLESQRRR